ncbi:MAG: polysaccharide biosynthesis/export family protein [Verrucomicrobiales bacterium]|nr:polysaccharide biosynthesis/export family protein [Verrucomicrobiales bacterium]
MKFSNKVDKRYLHIFVIIMLGVLGACKSRGDFVGEIPPPLLPISEELNEDAISEEYDLVVGDRLQIFVKEDPKFNKIYHVREHGDIIIPELGSILVAGLSVEEAGARVKERLEDGYLVTATVIVDRLIHWFWIPDRGRHAYGIFTGYGDRGRREGEARSSVSTMGIGSRAGEGRIKVFVTGKVTRPGEQQLEIPTDRALGVYDAILKSGGIERFGDSKKVHVMRLNKDGKRVKIGVNLKRVITGEEADVPIGHGDIIVVPEKVFGF